ncbi:MAG: hypothetical protein OXI44_04065 [Bacteroidota bacterium]|nr:hypothetical protein [Bacteroidota bacterium]
MKKLILLLALIPTVALAQEKAAPTEAEIVRLVLETPSKTVAMDAIFALKYDERRLGVLLDIYQALDGTQAIDSAIVLQRIAFAKGGQDYLMNLFASLEPPEEPCKQRPQRGRVAADGSVLYSGPPEEELCPYKTEWCKVGIALVRRDHLHPVHHSLIYPTCDNRKKYHEDGSVSISSH